MHDMIGLLGFVGALAFAAGTAVMILLDVLTRKPSALPELQRRALMPTVGVTGDGVPWVAGP